jgi:CHAT domain-containing protein/Tfp pilus assembly protein PilF
LGLLIGKVFSLKAFAREKGWPLLCLPMVQLLLSAIGVGQAIATGQLPPDCPELVIGKSLTVAISPQRQACVNVIVAPGEATQVRAEYPGDVVLRVHGKEKELLVDGFEFGQETATLSAPGQYRIEISPIDVQSATSALNVHISRKDLPLHTAADWQMAESLATNSKQTPTIANISASMERWQAVQDQPAIARTWLKLGDASLASRDLQLAYKDYEHALEVCHSIADTRCAAEAANNSGYTAQQLGNLADSSTRLDEASRDWQELALPLNQGKTLLNLGGLYSRAGDFQRAISLYDRAGAILKPLDSLAYAQVLNNLGLCYLSLAQYGEAKNYFRRAIKAEAKLAKAERDRLLARMNFGRALMLDGQVSRAKAILETLLSEPASGTYRDVRALILNNLGQILFRLDSNDVAEARLTEALELHKAIGDKRGQAAAEYYLGLIERKRSHLDTARELLSHALEISKICGLHDQAVDALFALAELEVAARNSERATLLAEEAIPLLESIRSHIPSAALRASFYARRRNLLDLLVAIAMRSDNPNANTDGLIAAEIGRSRALLDIVDERDRSSPKPPDLASRQAKIRREINFLSLLAAGPKQPRDITTRLEALIAEDQQVEASIRESIEDREPGARPLKSVSLVQQQILSPNRAILEYQLGERTSYLWLVRDHAVESFVLPSRSVIERRIQTAIDLFDKKPQARTKAMNDEYKKQMSRLSTILLGSLRRAALPPVLILVLDGDLYRVPFAALQFANGDYLGLSHDLVQAPSSAFLLSRSQQRLVANFPKSVLAVYDPVFSVLDPRVSVDLHKQLGNKGTNLARLPFKDELETIQNLVPQSHRNFLEGRSANALELEDRTQDQYGLVHLSTHAIINDQIPELSRIALSIIDRSDHLVGGFMFPYQLASLRLRHSVVVLSACDSALGKPVLGEGMVGFAGSLFSAGASQLVLTISDVDAQASSIFFSKLYAQILKRRPETIEHALTLTRKAFHDSDTWSDPYYWASIILIGAPSSIGVSRPTRSTGH